MHEKFVTGIFYTNQTYMDIGELETRPNTSKIIGWCHIFFIFIVKKICLAMSATVLHIFFLATSKKNHQNFEFFGQVPKNNQ